MIFFLYPQAYFLSSSVSGKNLYTNEYVAIKLVSVHCARVHDSLSLQIYESFANYGFKNARDGGDTNELRQEFFRSVCIQREKLLLVLVGRL